MPRAHACTRLRPHLPLRPPLRARGFSLVTVLLLIAVLASLGVGAMNAGLLQERMAGHARDRQQAMQAAEAALRDAEADIQANLSYDSAFTVGCTAGLCLPPSMSSAAPTSRPLWQTIDWSASAGQSRAYAAADDKGLGNGGINDPAGELLGQALELTEDTALTGQVLAHCEYSGVFRHRLGHGLLSGLRKSDLTHRICPPSP